MWDDGRALWSSPYYLELVPEQPLTDAQLAQVVEAVLVKLDERQPKPTEPAAPEGDPSCIQVGDKVLLFGSPGTVVAVHKDEACVLRDDGLWAVRLTHLTKHYSK
jgi:hypothetical protein